MARSLGFVMFMLGMLAFAPQAQAQPDKPLLTINFNQKHVYFDRAVTQAVTAAEQITPKVIYTVVSYLPAAGEGQPAISPEAEENVRRVVQRMQMHGVPADRINVMTHGYPSGEGAPGYQKIAVFVR